MLVNLNIADLAIVKSLDLPLAPGLSVLTGETGAGKSILLTALGLALGDRADSGYIRPGSKRAEINLEFDLARVPKALAWLEQNELDDGMFCLIRRTVSEDGRSKAYINNRPVTLQALQELSEMLVQIHGQHAHLTLLQPDEQRRLLDAFAQTQALVDQVNHHFHTWQKTRQELDTLLQSGKDKQQREDYLRYQLEELQQLNVEQFNYVALTEEHGKLANLEQIIATGEKLVDRLYENDRASVCQLLSQSCKDLESLTQFAPELANVATLLNEAQIQAEEAVLQLRRFLKNQDTDPARLATIETQLAVIQDLSRKHHVAPEELPALVQRLSAELDGLGHAGERIDQLTAELETLAQDYQQHAENLSKQRQVQALLMQSQITGTIQQLGMPQGEFLVQITSQKQTAPQRNGLDKIEFLVAANPGLPAKPLSKVASGGELSRISLAIQVAATSDATTPTMIFDEVDSGIGGGTAEIVGQKLRNLSQGRQVLCVTHLPQVAAQAHHHLYVLKSRQDEMTASEVKLLNENERIEEIARMLGGVTITENTRAHAREMLTTGN